MRGEHKIEMSDLRSFVTVAERGSFSAAALDLHLSQPALSRRIAKLESSLGVRLIERTTRRVDLTAVGRDFARKAREVLNTFESSLLGINEGTSHLYGEVTVACVPSAVIHFLPDVLKEYRRTYPRILVRVMDEGASIRFQASREVRRTSESIISGRRKSTLSSSQCSKSALCLPAVMIIRWPHRLR